MQDRSKDATGVDAINGSPGEYSPSGYRTDPARAFQADADSGASGFSGTCNTTLIDWIQLVQMGRRDAVLGVTTHDGQQSTLWCRDGDIIDAACDGTVGEDAVYRALSWKSGRVAIDFDTAVTRYRRIETPTAGLLLRAAYRRDSGIHELADLIESSDGSEASGPFDLAADRTEVSTPSHLAAFDERPTVDHGVKPRGLSLRFVLAGGLSVVLLFLAVTWRWMYPAVADRPIASAPEHARAAVRREPPSPPSPSAATPAVSKTASAQPSAGKNAPAHRHPPRMLARRSTTTPSAFDGSRPGEAPRAPFPARVKVDIVDEPAGAAVPRVQVIREADRRAQPRVEIIGDRKPRVDVVQ